MGRTSSLPQQRLADRRATIANGRRASKLMGAQISASRASMLVLPEYTPFSGPENLYQSTLTTRTPTTPSTGYQTPPMTPKPPPFRTSKAHLSFQTNSTANGSVSVTDSTNGNHSDSTSTSVSGANLFGAVNYAKPAKHKTIHTPHAVDSFPSLGPHYFPHGGIPVLSTSDVIGERPDNVLQNVTPFFSDPEKEYETNFKQKLKELNGKNSESQLCIEQYLLKSEKSWFGKLRAAELNNSSENGPPGQNSQPVGQTARDRARDGQPGSRNKRKPLVGLKRILRMKIGDWPVYSFLLAFVRNIEAHFKVSSSLAYIRNLSRARP